MTKDNHLKQLSMLTAAALAMSATPLASADSTPNPFGMTELSQGYNLATAEAKCGASKSDKATEGKCGGNKSDKAAEAKCGGNKSDKTTEGKCGGASKKAKAAESKCGEAKCGGSN